MPCEDWRQMLLQSSLRSLLCTCNVTQLKDVNIGTSDPFFLRLCYMIKVNRINVLPLDGALHGEHHSFGPPEYGLFLYERQAEGQHESGCHRAFILSLLHTAAPQFAHAGGESDGRLSRALPWR